MTAYDFMNICPVGYYGLVLSMTHDTFVQFMNQEDIKISGKNSLLYRDDQCTGGSYHVAWFIPTEDLVFVRLK